MKVGGSKGACSLDRDLQKTCLPSASVSDEALNPKP